MNHTSWVRVRLGDRVDVPMFSRPVWVRADGTEPPPPPRADDDEEFVHGVLVAPARAERRWHGWRP